MLEGTNFWESGRLDLYLNNTPTHAYVPPRDVQKIYDLAESKIADDGRIPIGIDHLPEDVINSNPILKKLDLLDVGYISAVEHDLDSNTVRIKEATLTNPLIKELYENGELDAVSIVSQVRTSDCPQHESLKVIDTERLDRVDIVAVGACESCNIPKPTDGSNMVYARKPLKEEETMADENITIEQIEELLDKKLDEKLEEKLEPLNERIESLEDIIEEEDSEDETPEDETDEVAAMRAELEDLKKQKAEEVKLAAASAKVDLAIRQGKIKPCDKETMTAFAMNSSEAFDNYIKEADVTVPLGARQSFVAGEEPEPEEKDIVAEVNAAFNKGE